MDDELARARRALRAVDTELSLTWGDVLDGVDRAGGTDARRRETVPVLPLDRRPTRRRRVAGVAAAAALVVALGLGAGAFVDRRTGDDRVPPADSGAPATPPGPSAVASSAVPDAAQLLVDLARQARRDADPCAVLLTSKEPKAVVIVADADLVPVRVLLGGTWMGRTPDGTAVGVDDRTETWWVATGRDDLLADQPGLAAAVAALRRLTVDGGRTWSLAGDGAATTLRTAVATGVATGSGAVGVDVTLDRATGLPVRVQPDGGTALDVLWRRCGDVDTDRLLVVEVPDGYTRAPGAPGATG